MPPATVISIRLPPDLAKAVNEWCRATGISRTDFLATLAARQLRVPYVSGTERTGWAGASVETIRKAVVSRTKKQGNGRR